MIPSAAAAKTPKSLPSKRAKLSDLRVGESARILRVNLLDQGCRRRFAEMGVYEGSTVSVTASGDMMILAVGGGRMAVSAHCASEVTVLRVA
jgi:Fe2+ transport system protein FeoA